MCMGGAAMSGDVSTPNPGMKVTALPLADLARLLSKSAGRTISPEALRRDVDAGAPVNPDGTINLVHYAAWLVKEYAARGD
jgi:hypothetical protein